MSKTDLEKLREELARTDEQDQEAPALATSILIPKEITAGKVRDLANSNPDHPCSPSLLRGVSRFPDEYPVICDKRDLQAVAENRKIEVTREEGEDGSVTVSKELGDELKPKGDKPKPKPAEKPTTKAEKDKDKK